MYVVHWIFSLWEVWLAFKKAICFRERGGGGNVFLPGGGFLCRLLSGLLGSGILGNLFGWRSSIWLGSISKFWGPLKDRGSTWENQTDKSLPEAWGAQYNVSWTQTLGTTKLRGLLRRLDGSDLSLNSGLCWIFQLCPNGKNLNTFWQRRQSIIKDVQMICQDIMWHEHRNRCGSLPDIISSNIQRAAWISVSVRAATRFSINLLPCQRPPTLFWQKAHTICGPDVYWVKGSEGPHRS